MNNNANLTAEETPRWATSENRGPLVSVLTWFLVITSFFAVAARVATRFAVVRQLRWDDAMIIVAMILSIGHSITSSFLAAHGLGQHIDAIPLHDIEPFQKTTFASGFLFIGIITAIKISICIHLDNLTPVRSHKNMIRALAAFTLLWMSSSFFVVGFQCHLPETWRVASNTCIDIKAFWAYYHIMNAVTDVALIIFPWMILSNLQVEARRKAVIIGCFAARIFVVALTVVQIYYRLGEVVLTLSLITACIPYLKPFMEALETGMMRANGGGPSQHGFGYGHRSTSRSLKKSYGPLSNTSNKPGRMPSR
ncbi:MAG: hypothetical protein Q9174_004920, partial [Haloplaca sp. 1 TL-2023]